MVDRFFGFTVFHLHLQTMVFSPYMESSAPIQLKNKTQNKSFEAIKDLLVGNIQSIQVEKQNENIMGKAQGILVGGNLRDSCFVRQFFISNGARLYSFHRRDCRIPIQNRSNA